MTAFGERVEQVRLQRSYNFQDHTTPWRCDEARCERCEDKPDYAGYMARYDGREVARR